MIILAALTFASTSFEVRGYGTERSSAVVDAGLTVYAGNDQKSLAGNYGFFVSVRALPRKGFFRPNVGIMAEYSLGLASINGETPSYDMFGGAITPGFQIHPFYEGRILPFISAEGYLGWNLLRLGDPPAGVDATSSGVTYGGGITGGADIRFGSLQGNAIRIQTGYWYTLGSLAGQSGFQLSGFRMSIGIVFAP